MRSVQSRWEPSATVVGSHPAPTGSSAGGRPAIEQHEEVSNSWPAPAPSAAAVGGRRNPGPDGQHRSPSLRGDSVIRLATTASVALLAVIAAVVSYGHMHALVLEHGEGQWASALIPLSVDGMIVASSMSLLLDSRLGGRGGLLPWALLIIGALASLGANIAVAEPTLIGRVIAAWPSFALTASYELLMRQVRRAAQPTSQGTEPVTGQPKPGTSSSPASRKPSTRGSRRPLGRRDLRRQAWEWALANRDPDGALPSGKIIAGQFGRRERWGRLVKQAGAAGEFAAHGASSRQLAAAQG